MYIQFFSNLMKANQEDKIKRLKSKKKPLSDDSIYEIDELGFVYNGTKRLSMSYRCGRWYVQLRTADGKNHMVDSSKLVRQVFGDSELELSRNFILNELGARAVEDFPRYAVTDYGAVYCIDPPKRGSKAGQRYLLRDKLHNDKRYVTLYHADGRRRTRQVDHLVRDAWGY